MNNFQSLEVVGRGSETQLQVGGNLNKLRLLFYYRFFITTLNVRF